MNINIKKIIIKIIIMIGISFFILFIFLSDLDLLGKYQYLNNIDYNVIVNHDGSINITETWDVYVKNTNTLFKSFDKSDKYGEITDVTVKDVDKNIYLKDFRKMGISCTKRLFLL